MPNPICCKKRKTSPRGSKIAPRALKDLPRGRQRPFQAVPRPTPEALGGPISSSNPLFSNVLNRFDFLIKMFIGSFQEAIEKIQELTKINISEPPGFQASMPPSLQASEHLPPSASAGFAKRKQFYFVFPIYPCKGTYKIPFYLFSL